MRGTELLFAQSQMYSQLAALLYRCSLLRPCKVTAATPQLASFGTTVWATGLLSSSPIPSFTVSGTGAAD